MEPDTTLAFYNEHASKLVRTYDGVEAGVKHYGLEARRLRIDTLPELRNLSDRYNAVLCAAVLQHVPDSQLLDSLHRDDIRWQVLLFGSTGSKELGPIAHLLRDHEGQRDTAIARTAYEAYSSSHTLECAWTGDRTRKFHVDHAIPWALWRNNDLWNLLPVHRRANGEKSARIPSRARVERQRSRISQSWEILSEAESAIFMSHARGFIGDHSANEFTGSTREELFSTFKDVLEYTAVNRGVERW